MLRSPRNSIEQFAAHCALLHSSACNRCSAYGIVHVCNLQYQLCVCNSGAIIRVLDGVMVIGCNIGRPAETMTLPHLRQCPLNQPWRSARSLNTAVPVT